jgi:hypothetical protein
LIEQLGSVVAADTRNHQVLTTCLALVLVLVFRVACVADTRLPSRASWRLISGLSLGIAAWTVGAVLQAWVPLWQMLLVGLVASLTLEAPPPSIRAASRAVADFVAVAALCPLSVIPVSTAATLSAAAAFAAVAFALDSLTARWRSRLQWELFALPAMVLVVIGLNVRQVGDFGSRLLAQDPFFVLRLALVVPNPGATVPLQHGTGAWILRTPRETSYGTAILLHGNDSLASWQPAALALQGSLMRAGYDVLSVDHAGYGVTPVPDFNADWRAWDPTIGPKRALSYLRDGHARAPATIVVAHSMGVDVALQWLSEGADIQAEYLFGGSIDRPTPPEQSWVSVFHRQRHIPCCMPLDTMRMVRDQFYGGSDRYALALPPDHANVHFVRFGIEYADVTRDREPLYADISAPKTAYDFSGVTHYFNTLSLRGGLVLIDTLAVRRTAAIFGRQRATPQPLLQATACGEREDANLGSKSLPVGCELR